MGIFNKVPLEKVIPHMQASGKRELVWCGVTIGQIGFGVLASVKRQPTKRAADAFPLDGKTRCPECTAKYHHSRNCTRR